MKLITHNGSFHYDEILATAILNKIYPNSELVRTRDMDIIATGDIVYDVGRIFDPSKNRFDHHQNTFKETYSEKYDVKLSSAGLIYKYFGDKLLAKYNFFPSSEIYEDIKIKIYNEFFLSADAIDNGIDIRGKIPARTVQSVVQSFNVCVNSKELENKNFNEALDFVSKDLDRYLTYVIQDYVVNYEILYKDLQAFTGDVFVTEKSFSTDLFFEIDKKLEKNTKFIVCRNISEWRILTLPVEKGSFKIKWPLHEKWRGLSGDELSSVSGITDCVFVHATGFTGGNKTCEGAVEMCRKSLEFLLNQKN